MVRYAAWLALCVLATACVVVYSWQLDSSPVRSTSPSFKQFQVLYLVVYCAMMAGDWLQGPYVYALYDSYGFSNAQIATLFVVGFGSSMVFGTFIGSLADRMGRKLFCLLYAALYIASCLTKHINEFWVLMFGRLLGGVATSLLFSVFDAWLVFEHHKRGFPDEWLSHVFSTAIFCNSLVAIVAGVAAQWCADSQELVPVAEGSIVFVGGFTAPFDLAILCLGVGGGLSFFGWSENYGTPSGAPGRGGSLLDLRGLKAAVALIRSDSVVLLCGLTQSLFEGAMYTFVFMWTPALTPPGSKPPYGLIFSTFMVCCMAGSSSYGILTQDKPATDLLLLRVLLVSAAALAVPVVFDAPGVVFPSFLVFEVCVGLYFPAISTIKSKVVPEESRAAVYNVFRVPLNMIVLAVLLSDMSIQTSFTWCTLMVVAAAACQCIVVRSAAGRKAKSKLWEKKTPFDPEEAR